MKITSSFREGRSWQRRLNDPFYFSIILLIVVCLLWISMQLTIITYHKCLTTVKLNQSINVWKNKLNVDVKLSIDDSSVYAQQLNVQNKHTTSDVSDECRKMRLYIRREYNISKETNHYIDNLCDYKLQTCERYNKKKSFKLKISSTTWGVIENENKAVEKGGWWQPNNCIPDSKVAIIIPYRNRENHLQIFLRNIHVFLQQQNLHYRIFVIDQKDDSAFNRGKLLNVGHKEAMKIFPFTCLVFHDVDLLPEDLRNYYGCMTSPQHLCVAIDTHNYRLRYEELFGGVEMFKENDFLKVNGFSNSFWGWGAEDDNLYKRIQKAQLTLWRQSHEIGRYKMLRHQDQEANGIPNRNALLDESSQHYDTDGLNTLQYKVISFKEKTLYTHIEVNLRKSKDKMFGVKDFPK